MFHRAFLAGAVAALAGCSTLQPPSATPAAAASAPSAAAAASAPPALRGGGAQPLAPGAAAPIAAVAPGGAASGLRPPGAASAASAPATPPQAAAAGGLRPFADVVRDAKRSDGVLTLWTKDDRAWIELKPSDFGTPFFLSSKLKTGIGERGFFGGLMQESGIVEFRRVHNAVQMLWRNVGFTARKGTPEGLAIESGYSPSLLASAPVLSQPEPERKSILVEVNTLFLSDLLALGMDLQRTYRQGYAFDPRNSSLATVRAMPDAVVIEVLSHFATASISTPTPGAPPGAPQPSAPRTLPDPRSLFMTLHHSLARLPEEPMAGRKADPRIGYFESGRFDFTNDLSRTPRTRFVNRWRLEKKDPSAELSEPVKPIVYWLDRSIPVRYRETVRAGVLEWNKAFERIGFKDALRVEIQPDDADWDTLDITRPSIRWMASANPSFGAIGPSHVDPRSGEILDADIGLESLSSRNVRNYRAQLIADGSPDPLVLGASAFTPEERRLALTGRACTMGDYAAEQLAYATDLLEARGDLPPDGPEAEAFVLAYLKDVTMHEVGHTLGLRHNFRSSRAYSLAQLSDPSFTRANGIAGSVMEYAPINLNTAGEPRLTPGGSFGETLGPYDYWAIEYAYRPFPPGTTPAEEAQALERIASRSAEPLLAYGTDEDNLLGIDPETLQFDLGNEPVAFARKRIAIARELLTRQETRQLLPTDDYALLRRSVMFALRDVARSAGIVARQIGGVRTVRDAPGTGRDPLTPVSAADQRAALELITTSLLAADSLRVSPALQRRLGPDFAERLETLRGQVDGSALTDYSPSTQVLGMQRALLAQLMNDTVATRLLESTERSPDGAERALRMPELYARLQSAVWSELDARADVAPLRREVQRDHVNRIAALLLRPGAASRADTRSIVRVQARGLLEKLRAASARGGVAEETRAHLVDSADTLEQALNARLQRQGV